MPADSAPPPVLPPSPPHLTFQRGPPQARPGPGKEAAYRTPSAPHFITLDETFETTSLPWQRGKSAGATRGQQIATKIDRRL
eukprot:3775827-Prymnesium_polylepis.1